MKTECPHCNTIFAITEEQLDLANGMVRCGVCDEVFNALVQDDLFVAADDSPADISAEQVQPVDIETTTLDATDADDDTSDAEDLDDVEAIDIAAVSDTDENDWQQPRLSTPADDVGLFDSGDGSVVPDDIRHDDNRPGLLSSAVWGLASLLLLACLALQFAWLERDLVVRSGIIKPYMDDLCERIDCDQLGIRAPDMVEMTSRNVYTHPTVDDALMVSLGIVNRASFAQPYPDIRIHFSDVIGNVIASRRFRPDEYLAIDRSDLKSLQPDAPVSFGIEIRDPGDRALTYEFEFL